MGSLLPVVDDDSEHGRYRALMFCIGSVVRGGTRTQKAALLAVLRRLINDPSHAESSRSQADGEAESENPRPHLLKDEPFVRKEKTPSSVMGRYTKALQEYGDQNEFKPFYRYRELSDGSPYFHASVIVDGTLYEGVAATKKQARHEAAKKACLAMNIEI